MNLDSITSDFDLSSTDPYPLSEWTPELSGDIDITITKDGRWIHEGEEIKRKPLVRLFASLVKEEAGEYFLVTPVEKWRISVEDKPLHVLSVALEEGYVVAILSNGRQERLDQASRLHLESLDGVEVPVMVTTQGPQARFTRNAYYALIEGGELTDAELIVKSGSSTLRVAVDT